MSDALDARLDDLDAGFRDLLAGLRGVVDLLRAENAMLMTECTTLRARLEERRMMDREQVVAPVAEAPPVPRDRLHAQRTCHRCGGPFLGRAQRKFCGPCFRIQAAERLAAGRDAHLAKAVDARLRGEPI